MEFSNPQKNVQKLHLTEGMHVADFGAGSGDYALALAARVGATGFVYAIDIQKDLLLKLKRDAEARRLKVEVIRGDLDQEGGSKLGSESMDAAIVSNILFQADQKEVLAKEVYRILKPDGYAMVIDWSDSFGNIGPIPEHVIKKEVGRDIFLKAGFELDREFEAGSHHWGLIFKKGK